MTCDFFDYRFLKRVALPSTIPSSMNLQQRLHMKEICSCKSRQLKKQLNHRHHHQEQASLERLNYHLQMRHQAKVDVTQEMLLQVAYSCGAYSCGAYSLDSRVDVVVSRNVNASNTLMPPPPPTPSPIVSHPSLQLFPFVLFQPHHIPSFLHVTISSLHPPCHYNPLRHYYRYYNHYFNR